MSLRNSSFIVFSLLHYNFNAVLLVKLWLVVWCLLRLRVGFEFDRVQEIIKGVSEIFQVF